MSGGGGWTTVGNNKNKKKPSRKEKKKAQEERRALSTVDVPVELWRDEFTQEERDIFLLLRTCYPRGMRSEDIARQLNLEHSDTGIGLYLFEGELSHFIYKSTQDKAWRVKEKKTKKT